MIYTIKRHNTDEPLRVTLQENGAAFVLTGYDVFILFGTDPKSAPLFRRVCVVEDAVAGKVRYDWQAGDTDAVGDYFVEFEAVAIANSKVRTFPNADYVRLQILDNIGLT